MTLHYFAYGSNLCLPRLRRRVPGVRLIGLATLRGYELVWHKRSNTDGSGKCSIRPSTFAGDRVLGALFLIPPEERSLLDAVEGLGFGYEEARIGVCVAGPPRPAWTYVASPSHRDDALRPFAWYRDLVVAGSRGLGIADAYVRALEAVDAIVDPDADRARTGRAFLPCADSG